MTQNNANLVIRLINGLKMDKTAQNAKIARNVKFRIQLLNVPLVKMDIILLRDNVNSVLVVSLIYNYNRMLGL